MAEAKKQPKKEVHEAIAPHIQTEKVFLKQHLRNHYKTKYAKKGGRFVRKVGLGFEIPKEAKEGKYLDKKCPFTGDVSIRGRVLTGVVASKKMKRSITIRRDYLHYLPKYKRYEKRHKMVTAHCSPAFRINVGDLVTIGECRPLSKTIRFNVLRIERTAGK